MIRLPLDWSAVAGLVHGRRRTEDFSNEPRRPAARPAGRLVLPFGNVDVGGQRAPSVQRGSQRKGGVRCLTDCPRPGVTGSTGSV